MPAKGLKSVFFSLLGCCAAIVFAGCATLTRGTVQEITFQSDPPGARIFVDGEPIGSTPAEAGLTVTKDHLIVIRKQGYRDEYRELSSILSDSVVAEFFLGGIVGGLIDNATGADRRLTPGRIAVVLESGDSPNPVPGELKPAVSRLAYYTYLYERGITGNEEYETDRCRCLGELAVGYAALPSSEGRRVLENLCITGIITEEELARLKGGRGESGP